MTRTIDTVREGYTDPRVWQLTHDDAAATTLTGLTATNVFLTSIDGQAVNTAGKWSLDTATGLLTYSPAASDFAAVKSPYRLCVELTDGSSKTRPYPDHFTAEIAVLAARA
jgi:hypothetical protein